MNFSKTTTYSLKILHHLANINGKTYSANDLCQELNIPYPYCRQILKKLCKFRFVSANRGRIGGYKLAKNANEIYIGEVISAIEGLEIINQCVLGLEECPFDHKCALHENWSAIREEMKNLLNSTSLDLFVKK